MAKLTKTHLSWWRVCLAKQESTILCKCGCGQFITNRSAKNVEKGKQNAGYIHGHIWKGKELPQSIKDKMNANRRDNKGEKS